MTTNEIIKKAIDSSDMKELKSIGDLIKQRKENISKSIMRDLKIGDRVQFENRYGEIQVGTVRKKNIKRCVIDTHDGGWNVPASMLQAVEKWDE